MGKNLGQKNIRRTYASTCSWPLTAVLLLIGPTCHAKVPPLCRPGFWTQAVYDDGDVNCKPCPKGAVTVADAEGWTSCIGSRTDSSCPPGWGEVGRNNAFVPVLCVPCPVGEESIVFTRAPECPVPFPICIKNPCLQNMLPVRRPGPVEIYDCAEPLEKNIPDWAGILMPGRQGDATAIPACPPGTGLGTWVDGHMKCIPCIEDQEIVLRQGWPVCSFIEHRGREGHKIHRPCGLKKVQLRGGGCAACPKGSRLSSTRGGLLCLPHDQAEPAAK